MSTPAIPRRQPLLTYQRRLPSSLPLTLRTGHRRHVTIVPHAHSARKRPTWQPTPTAECDAAEDATDEVGGRRQRPAGGIG